MKWFLLFLLLTLTLIPLEASAAPSYATAQAELPYLRMSLVMNSSFHLVQWPLHLQGQLKLTKARAIVSFGGGLLYAGTAALAFTTNRTAQHIGIYSFMGISAIGATFVTYGLINCRIQKQAGCGVKYFDALNAFILANQVVAWTLGVRQLTAEGPSSVARLPMELSLLSGTF
jgi:hypothetical protein